MPLKFINKIGGLDKITPEDSLSPENAVVAQYFDPFRAKGGTIAPAFGFKRSAIYESPSNWESTSYKNVLAVFEMGGVMCFITGDPNSDAPGYNNVSIWWKNTKIPNPDDPGEPDVSGIQEIDFGSLVEGNAFPVIPSRIVVDPNVYYAGDPNEDNYFEWYNAYFFGWNESDGEHKKPYRLCLSKLYHHGLDEPENYTLLWSRLPLALTEFPDIIYTSIRNIVGNQSFGDVYRYYFIFEDLAGNFIYNKDPRHNIEWDSTDLYHPELKVQFIAGGNNFFRWGISKVHVYRVNKTSNSSDTDDELFAKSRWLHTFEFQGDEDYWGNEILVYVDTDPAGNNLGDLVYPDRQELFNWCSNCNKAHEEIGIHNGAMWVSKENETFFSEYTLDAPNGVRPLNFPTNNRWKFDGIGHITSIQSVDKKLHVFGTEGITTLAGSYLDNFYEQKVSSVGTISGRPEYGEFINLITVIDNNIYFVSKDGRPHILRHGLASEIGGIVLQFKGTTTEYTTIDGLIYVLNPLDSCAYRNGWVISNGTSMYLFHPAQGRWVEWPKAVKRFIVGRSPYNEKTILDGTTYPTPSGVTEHDYFRWWNGSGWEEVYST